MPNSPDPHFTEDEAESLGPIVELDGESEISPTAPNSTQPPNQSPHPRIASSTLHHSASRHPLSLTPSSEVVAQPERPA